MILDGFAKLITSQLSDPNWNTLLSGWDDDTDTWTSGGPNVGVFPIQLPRNYITASNPQAIVYKRILSRPTYVLEGQTGYTELELQLDCHGFGNTPENAVNLALAVEGALRGGWQGTLADDDATYVHGIFQQSMLTDFYNSEARTYVTILEYKIIYEQI